MTVVLGNLCGAVSLHQALREKEVESLSFRTSMKSVFSQRLHAAARRATGRFFLYEDISFYAVWDNSYYQPMFML